MNTFKKEYLKQRKILSSYTQDLLQIGLPISLVENYNSWQFFLQEGIYFPLDWNYEDELSEIQQEQLHAILLNMEAEGQTTHDLLRLRIKYGS